MTAMSGLGRQHDGGYAEYTCVDVENAQVVGAARVGRAGRDPGDDANRVGQSLPRLGASHDRSTAHPGWHHERVRSPFPSLSSLSTSPPMLRWGDGVRRGLAAAALAHDHGCFVASTSRSATSRALILAAGAHDFLLDDGNLAATLSSPGDKFDKVLELVGPTTLRDSLKCCAGGKATDTPLGVVCMTGVASGVWTMDGFTP